MQEIWKPIKEFENQYEISNYGNVRSLYKYDVNKRKYILRKVPYNMKVVNDRGYNIKYMQKHQNEIKERNEMRIEILENIYYGIDNGIITTVEEVKKIIDKNLLENY